jgi:coenzyme F420 hydrogenase subunit beta
MSAPQSLEEVVTSGLCVGCGLCQSMAGSDRIELRINDQGYLRPSFHQSLDRALERRILDVCPGAVIEGPRDLKRNDPIWGPVGTVWRAQAADDELRHRGSSGGVLTALALDLLDTGTIDAVLHVGPDPDRPMRSVARISTDRAGLLAGIGARYNPAAPLTEIHRLSQEGRRFALIGKPCDVAAAKRLARRVPAIEKHMVACFAFFCAGVPSHTISQALVGKYGLGEDDVTLLRYRGQGCPGPTRIEAGSRAFEQSYDETWSDELSQEIQFRCKICPDATGETADIACCDAWITADGLAHGEYENWNAVLPRTGHGTEMFRSAMARGVLRGNTIAPGDLARMQPHQVERKMAIAARRLGAHVAGIPTPRMHALGIWRAALKAPLAFLSNAIGTFRRVRSGRNRETLPTARTRERHAESELQERIADVA